MQEARPGKGGEAEVGGGEFVVQAGDCIFSIADEHGFHWETIWKHADNRELVEARGSPHVLRPGDKLVIPDLTRREESGATEARHRFRRKGVPIEFAIEVFENGKPRSGVPYTLTIEGRETSGKIPGDGVVKASIHPGDRSGELRVGEPHDERVYPIMLGRLDPAHTRSGAIHRLRNMGLLATDVPDANSYKLALERFQKQQDLDITGQLDAPTIDKLAQQHGS